MCFLLLLLFVVVKVAAFGCPPTTANIETKPLYLLTLVPFPDPSNDAGWDRGLGALPGARVAQDEINNRTDLLPGYHIELIEENIEACSLTEAGIGLTNLVKYTVNPPCHPVVAVVGLLCSSHTSIVSPVAGHDGFDLIQLSVANSPIFRTQNNSFPHLWRVLGAGTVYADTTLALMDRFSWKRIAIVYEFNSAFFTHVATYFENLVKTSTNKEVIFSTGILNKGNDIILEQIVSDLQEQAATVMFVALSDHLASELLCRLEKEELVYPAYIWIQIGKRLNRIFSKAGTCNATTLLRAKQGHIQLQIASAPSSESTILVSGEEYSGYKPKYDESLKQVEEEYNTSILPDLVYSSLLYDQVWAFALAMNHSLPVLENRNLSIDNYTIGQLEITKVIEEQMAKLNFQGASGNIKFNDKHGVFATVDIYQVNGSDEVLVGSYVPQLNSEQVSYNLTLSIDNSSVPDDEPVVTYIGIHLAAAVFLYSAAGLTIVFNAVVLILLLYFREWSEVKATSPYISIIMLIGCFLLCFAVIFRTTYAWFPTEGIRSTHIYSVLVSTDFICIVSGLSVVIITLFFKLLRVFHIFFNITLKVRALWKTHSLVLLILVLSSWPSFMLLGVLLLTPPTVDYYVTNVLTGSVITTESLPFPSLKLSVVVSLVVVVIYLLIFLICILYFAIRMRKINRTDFKDTKKVNIFVAILTVTLVMTGLTTVPLILSHNHPVANIVMAIGLLIVSNSTSVTLFLPKVIPAMFKPRPKPRPLRRNTTLRTVAPASSAIFVKIP